MYLCKYFPFVDNRTVVVINPFVRNIVMTLYTRFTELSWALEFMTTTFLSLEPDRQSIDRNLEDSTRKRWNLII